MDKLFLALILLISPAGAMNSVEHDDHSLSGIIYFTNNSPDNVDTFPVELYTHNRKRRLAITTANANGTFKLVDVKPGKYLLKFTWMPDRCTLWYRVEVPRDSSRRIRVIMDAACAQHNGKIQDLEEN